MHLTKKNIEILCRHPNSSKELTKYFLKNKGRKVYAFYIGFDSPNHTEDGYVKVKPFEKELKEKGLANLCIFLSTAHPRIIVYDKEGPGEYIWITGQLAKNLSTPGSLKEEKMFKSYLPAREIKVINDIFFKDYLGKGICSVHNSVHHYDEDGICVYCKSSRSNKRNRPNYHVFQLQE